MSSLVEPSAKIAFWDGPGRTQHAVKTATSTGSCRDGKIAARHNEGANILFHDWHVKWARETAMRQSEANYQATTTASW